MAAGPSLSLDLLESIAKKVGTPFWIYDAEYLRARIADIKKITAAPGIQARYAMKAWPTTRVLKEMLASGIWIDAVSGNEALRAIRAGFQPGNDPPVVCFTADVFRDSALDAILKYKLLPNIGSPGMIPRLQKAGYSGPIAVRVNPGFGHGHVNACDTGGPSSKHGVWFEHVDEVEKLAKKAGMQIVMLHAHIGSGPKLQELLTNFGWLVDEFAGLLPQFPDVKAVNLGGGIPHQYREGEPAVDISPLGELLANARKKLCDAAGHEIRLEIEPGRYYVAGAGTLVGRVADVKHTHTNEKGQGETFVMVDAGFVDLARVAMYGAYHAISIPAKAEVKDRVKLVVAGPLCESGDVFTRDSEELLAPRSLPIPDPGDLLLLHDAGAYGYAMSSNYNSIGRAPQVWLEPDGNVMQISRRETIEDLLDLDTDTAL